MASFADRGAGGTFLVAEVTISSRQRHERPLISEPTREVMAVGLIGLAVVAIYAQIGAHRTIPFDDSLYLTDNVWVQGGLTWEAVLWSFTNVVSGNWHPVTWISHLVDQELFGNWLGAHMIENLFWHFGNSVLVYRLFRALEQPRVLAVGLALVFACHPLNVESVAWLSQRKTQISTFLLLATLLVYLEWRVTRRRSSRFLMTVAFAISLMAKAMGVTLPFLLVLFELLQAWPRLEGELRARAWGAVLRRVRCEVVKVWPLVAAAILVAAATFFAQRNVGAMASIDYLTVGHRILNAFGAVGTYLYTFIVPSELCLFYPLAESPPWAPAAFGILLIAFGTLLAMLGARRSVLVAFGWIWFLFTLLPVIGLVQVGSQSHADRYMYVPMIGLLLALGAWFSKAGFPGCRVPLTAWTGLTYAFAVGMGVHAYAYTMTWRDPETAYRRSLEVGGVSYVMLANLSATLTNLNYYKTAEFYAEICVQIWPDRPLVVVNLASVKGLLNKLDEAEAGFRRAMALEPDNVRHPYMLALVLLQTGRNQEAEAVLNDALRLLPPENDWRKGNQMIRRILLRQIPMPQLPVQGLLTSDPTPPGNQREPK
jgi:hypothetical protein